MTTDRDIALVKAALEAAVKATELPGNRWDAQDRILALDPAAIAATVPESDPLPAMIEAQKELVKWQSLGGDLFQASHRDAKRIVELEQELAALRQRIAELEHKS